MTRELWVINGRDPVLWSVPVWVKWKEPQVGELINAVPLLGKQHQAIRRVLEPVSKRLDGGLFEITEVALSRIGFRASAAADPETLLSWEKPSIQRTPFQEKRDQERMDFLDALYARGVGKSRAELEVMWRMFCDHALDWLVNREQPVNMYFLTLHPSPYRQNWKTILWGRFPWLGRRICHEMSPHRDLSVDASGLREELLSLDLLAMHRRAGWCYRHVEVEHKRAWYRMMEKVEKRRLAELGSVRYAAVFLGSVRRRIGASLRIYLEFLQGIARPTAADVESGMVGEYRLAPNLRPQDCIHLRRVSTVQPAVAPNDLPVYKPASDARVLHVEDEPLPDGVPVVQPSHADLRDARGDLHRPPKRKDQTLRMLVLSSGQERDERELLAMGGDVR